MSKKIAGVLLLIALWILYPMELFRQPVSLLIEDREGALLGAKLAADGQWRFPPSLNVPEKFIAAITAFEDKRFYYHPGVDPFALFRAVRQNISRGKRVSGGSTITMQVIRLSRKEGRRGWLTKIIETVYAVKLDLTSRKERVLSLYVNNAPFGGNCVGLEAASWRYFGRSPDRLSWAETATLAVLPNEPALVHPGRNRGRLLKKRDALLRKLESKGVISSIELKASLSEPLMTEPEPIPRRAPYLLDRIQKDLAKGNHTVQSAEEFRIRTTIDLKLQEQVEEILQMRYKKLESNGIRNGAALVLDAPTGKVLAYAGNIQESSESKDVDVIAASRSTGSILKPLLYAAMLDNGDLLPTTLVPDIPTNIGGFTPKNFNRSYEGAVPASKALARSLNVPAVRMLQRYGVGRFHQILRNIGMSTVTRDADNYGISIILGGVEGNLWELTGIYAGLARSVNNKSDSSPFFQPTWTENDITVKKTALSPISAAAAYCALEAMEEVVRPGEEGAWREFESSQRIAWKTGTSFGFRDGWAIGCTQKYAVGVWIGNATGEGRPGLIGIETAAPILFDIFSKLPHSEWFKPPYDELVNVEVCSKSGFRSSPYCRDTKAVRAPKAGLKVSSCPYHRIINIDKSGLWQVNSECEQVADIVNVSWFVLPPSMEYYYKETHSDYKSVPPVRSDCDNASLSSNMEILYPSVNTNVFIPREISCEEGKVILKASHHNPDATLFWHIDDQFLGSTTRIHEMAVASEPGQHRLVLVDNKGCTLDRVFTVLGTENKR
ncbi:MAG: penicillin-binding protein 1C [Fibrobacteres bacterium]|nr:penicillin-binding protein 1C [Fibrobacterota bacterium]